MDAAPLGALANLRIFKAKAAGLGGEGVDGGEWEGGRVAGLAGAGKEKDNGVGRRRALAATKTRETLTLFLTLPSPRRACS